ncbi:MAG: lytic transglycosylase [Alphaproteobacteria bacterium HGW-Alphaproteobacteria-2]|nr:MAG: lytic transglycosylase [Alphaproteobacteria bacterium HGW-Alphaproteobacteria-2]
MPFRLPALLLALLAACATTAGPPEPASAPATRWDHRPEAAAWTAATMQALAAAPGLLAHVPADVGEYCPAYPGAAPAQRAAFWTGYLSALAKYESRWNPAASGAGGRYRGLMQIAPATAHAFGCDAGALYEGAENLACAVRILAVEVPARGAIVAGPTDMGGVTSHWPPARKPDNRAEIATFTAAQDYCR